VHLSDALGKLCTWVTLLYLWRF